MTEVNNFAITEPVKEAEEIEEFVPLNALTFVAQVKGLRAIRKRKRAERRAMNKILYTPRKAKKAMKKMGISNKIQRGFDIAGKL